MVRSTNEIFDNVCDLIKNSKYKDDVIRVSANKRTYETKYDSSLYGKGEKYVQIEFIERGKIVRQPKQEIPFDKNFLDKVKKIANNNDDYWEYLGTEGDPGSITISVTEVPVHVEEEDKYPKKREKF